MREETKDKFRAFLIGGSMGLAYLYFKRRINTMAEGYEADYEHEFGGEELINKLKQRGYRPQRSWSFGRMVDKYNPEEHQVIVIPHLKMVDIDKRW